LDLRTRLSRCFAFDLVAGNRSLDARIHAPAVCAKVGVAVRRDEEQATGLGSVDPVFEFPRLAGEPVEVVAHDRVK